MNAKTILNETAPPVGAQTANGDGPPRESSVDCPKCGQAIYIEEDTRPDGKIVCDACKKRFAGYDALMQAVRQAKPPPAVILGRPVEIDLIDPNPEQPRVDFPEAELKELAESIQQHGVIQAITGESSPHSGGSGGPGGSGGRYILHDGERRLRAARLAGLTEIPALILQPGADRQELLLRAIVANDQRSDLSAIERAKGYQRLADEYGLSDADIARQVGNKSRSAIANTRRLLNLPKECQAQVASGELNERQALALLPLYSLPSDVQADVLDHWDGKKLANPKNLTSDQIRNHLNAATRGRGQALEIITADQVITADGKHIRSATCADCDHYLKIGQDMLCFDHACLKVKQNLVITAYLEQASAATGLTYLDPAVELKYTQTDGFGDTSGTLESALEAKCANLRLEFRRRSWDYGPGPDAFDNCRYRCFHNGEGCACAGSLKAEKEAAAKAKKEAIKQLTNQATNHITRIIRDNHPNLFRAILNTMLTNYYGGSRNDLTHKLKPDQVIHKLAKQLVERNTDLSEYRDLEVNRVDIETWLANMGLPPMDAAPATSAVPDLDRRLLRIYEWCKKLTDERPTLEQVRGNLSNLAELANEATAIQDAGSDADRAALAEAGIVAGIDALKTALLNIQPIVTASADFIEIEHVSWLVTVPAGDVNFKSTLERVCTVATLDYTLALIGLHRETKGAVKAIESRRRKITGAGVTQPADAGLTYEAAV